MTLTGAGATYPGGVDPKDSNIRIAPTYPTLAELDEASCLESISRMPARVKCAELAWRTLDEMLATGADSASAADPCVCDCGDHASHDHASAEANPAEKDGE